MFVYLAHPIDQANQGSTLLSRTVREVVSSLNSQGHSVYRPGRAYDLGLTYFQRPVDEPAVGLLDTYPTKDHFAPRTEVHQAPTTEDLRLVDRVNRAAIREVDALVAVLLPGVPTLGTPAEVEYALSLNKPVNLVSTRELFEQSVQLQSWLERGATGSTVNQPDGTVLALREHNWAERLGSLPRPEQLDPRPPLLVTGLSQNLVAGKYEGDAGFDLAISEDVRLKPGDYALVGTGVHVAVPAGYYGLITGRSSTWAKHRTRVTQGVIDAGYRGELKVGLLNEDAADWFFETGTRLAQLLVQPVFDRGLHVVPELPPAERGHAGFGSSGR